MNDTKIKDLGKLFTQKGYNVVIGDSYRKMEEWLSYFRGSVNNLHHFTRKTMAGRKVDVYKPSLQMPKKVAEEWAGLTFNEKVQLLTGKKASQDVLDKVLIDNHFVEEMTTFLELVMGVYGTGAIIEYVADDKVKLNFVYGDKIMVIDYENSTIKGIAVVDEFDKGKMTYTHVMYHLYRKTITDYDELGEPIYSGEPKYRIEHEIYETRSGNKGIGHPNKQALEILFSEQEINEMAHPVYNEDGEIIDVIFYMEYDSEPHFQVFKPAIVNNYDVKSPMGMPLTANAVSSFDGIDSKSYNLNREDSLTRTRIFVDDRVMTWSKVKDSSGNIRKSKYFDEDDDVYQVITGLVDGNDSVVTSNPTYDSAPRIEAIKLDLGMCGFQCGLGTDYFSFEAGSVYVNEANVISSNSDTWRNRQKHVNRLHEVLVGMVKAVLFLSDIDYNESNIDIMFDDSIITDNTAKIIQLRLDAQDGLVPEYMYIMEQYKVNKDEALKIIEEAKNQDDLDEPLIPIVPPTEEPVDDEVDDEEDEE